MQLAKPRAYHRKKSLVARMSQSALKKRLHPSKMNRMLQKMSRVELRLELRPRSMGKFPLLRSRKRVAPGRKAEAGGVEVGAVGGVKVGVSPELGRAIGAAKAQAHHSRDYVCMVELSSIQSESSPMHT